jgi:hypothetical protein
VFAIVEEALRACEGIADRAKIGRDEVAEDVDMAGDKPE